MKENLFCLIDASSFIFRAFYAVRPLSNKNGLPTNAIFGFAHMLLKVLEDFDPSHIAVVYDTKHPSFRKLEYPEYKANRTEMPEDLAKQIPYIKKLVECLGLPAFEQPGFEADDIIGTFAERARHAPEQAEVCIISSDKDLMQLVDEKIYLFDTMKDQKFGPEQVKEKLGVYPNRVIDFLGLVGDSSDNIPGVKGIGPKGALALLEQFDTVEKLYAQLDEVKKENQRKLLESAKKEALLSKYLATVKCDLDIKTDWHQLRCKLNFGDSLWTLLQELDFHALEKKLRALSAKDSSAAPASPATLPSAGSPSPTQDSVTFHCLQSIAELENAFARLHSAEWIAIDTETNSLAAHDASLVGFSFCGDAEHSYYVPLFHQDMEQPQISGDTALKALEKFLHGKKVCGQNLKFDWNVFRAKGLELPAKLLAFDTMLAAYVLEPEGRHNLDLLALKYLNRTNISYSSVTNNGKITFSEVPLEQAKDYAAEDAYVAFRLREILQAELEKQPPLEKVFREIDLPLVAVLADMEWEGVKVDVPLLHSLSREFGTELAELEKKAHVLAGREFNLASPKQLAKILFEDLQLPVIKKTKTGYSTDVEVLEKLAPQHPLPALILEHRELSKLKSTYVDVLPELAHKGSGRVHTSYNLTVAATGRLSSSDPNLQNIPIRTKTGKRVRAAFIAREGFSLLGADYSQIELRILASMSGDPTLCRAFQENQDIHALMAAQIFQVPLDQVTPELRGQAKAINFGILYGKSAFSLAEELGISRATASDIIKKYFERTPTVRGFLDQLIHSAKDKGYAETVFGRRRRIEGIDSKNKMILGMAERMAVNTPIQGTAADLIKLAMQKVHKELHGFKSKLILQVHDELVIEVEHSELERVRKLVKNCMESAGGQHFQVPMVVDIGVGDNWLEI